MALLLNRIAALLLIAGLVLSPTWSPWVDHLNGTAMADDDDDDDDGDDDDDDDDGGGGGGSGSGSSSSSGSSSRSGSPSSGSSGLREFFAPLLPRPVQPQRPARQTPAAVVLPDNAPDEIITVGLSDEDLSVLLDEGYELISERVLPSFDLVSRRLRVPRGSTLEAARLRVRALPTGQGADFNHYYRSNQGPEDSTCEGLHCDTWHMVSWTPSGSCGAGIRLGMIDTRVNDEHQVFATAALRVERLADEALDRSRAVHGTAVAALLVGDGNSRSPGLLPDAELVAVDVFSREGGDERADVEGLVSGLDYLAGQDVPVINLSLAGPANTVLEQLVQRMTEQRGTVLVAAAGNAGPRSEPLYPAAYEAVIAVTAVTLDGRVYRRAVQGPHIDLAAPGVDVWSAASVSGARWHTGTSFAAPFVTAAVAALLHGQPDLASADVLGILAGSAEDLGEPGRDPMFGHGLVSMPLDCSVEVDQSDMPKP